MGSWGFECVEGFLLFSSCSPGHLVPFFLVISSCSPGNALILFPLVISCYQLLGGGGWGLGVLKGGAGDWWFKG